MQDVFDQVSAKRAMAAVQSLEKHDFKAMFLSNRQLACAEILKNCNNTMRIGVGGSVTIREIGLLQSLQKDGFTVYDHWDETLSPEQKMQNRLNQLTCDLYLTSANAITLNGEIINIDGAGNRINAMTFGPKKVYIVAGINKIVRDLETGIKRIKDIATPLNAKRLKINVPCVEAGRCVDCNSPNRLCRALLILERRPVLTDITVIIVGETLGF